MTRGVALGDDLQDEESLEIIWGWFGSGGGRRIGRVIQRQPILTDDLWTRPHVADGRLVGLRVDNKSTEDLLLAFGERHGGYGNGVKRRA